MKRFRHPTILPTVLLLSAFLQARAQPTSEYLWQPTPGDVPVLFAPGVVSVEGKNTHALVFSSDGNTAFFSRYPDGSSTILTREGDHWSDPRPSFFFGKEVSIAANGSRLYYYTNGDIYTVAWEGNAWSPPVRLDSTINTGNAVEFFPCLVANGSLYFSRGSTWANGRLMRSRFQDGHFEAPEDLGPTVNNGGALHGWVAPDERYILFNSPRKGSRTRLDIWITVRDARGSWTEPQNLGPVINAGGDAILCPTVSPDGRYLFFTRLDSRTHTGNVYWISMSIVDRIVAAVTAGAH